MSNATSRSTGGAAWTGVCRSASSTATPPDPMALLALLALPGGAGLATGPRSGGLERLHPGLVLVVGLGAEADHADQEEHDREHRHDAQQPVEAIAHGGENGQRQGELDALHERVGEALVELSPVFEIVHVSGSSLPAGGL